MPKGSGLPTAEAIPLLADALSYYDETDVVRWFERNKKMTGRYPRVDPSTIENVRTFQLVPNEPFRKAWIELRQPMVLGIPQGRGYSSVEKIPVVEHHVEPGWAGLLREELIRVLALPEGFDSRPKKIGPRDLSCSRLADYLRSTLGIKTSEGAGGTSLAWLLQYEVAEALCKTLGLIPYRVGI